MSHIVGARMVVRDLDAVEVAADECGLTLMRGQKTMRCYQGQGACDHALKLKDARPGDYEIGLRTQEDGFGLVIDTWGPGRRLVEAAGPEMNTLRREYSAAVLTARARKKLAPKGFTTTREDLPGGRIRLRLRRR